MAYDLLRGKIDTKDWSCGVASDLPSAAKGYAPQTWWNHAQMEAKLSDIMSKPRGTFGFGGGKPSRDEAMKDLVAFMKSNKIGPMDKSSGIGAEVGSFVFPAKQQQALHNKIDDVRYDIRGAKRVVGISVLALSGAIAFLGLSAILRKGN